MPTRVPGPPSFVDLTQTPTPEPNHPETNENPEQTNTEEPQPEQDPSIASEQDPNDPPMDLNGDTPPTTGALTFQFLRTGKRKDY